MPTICTCGGGHSTFGECMRAKNIRIGYCRSAANVDYSAARHNERELARYKAARAEGIQPGGTTTEHVDRALRQADKLGRAVDASKESV